MLLLVVFFGFASITLVFFLILSHEEKRQTNLFHVLAHRLRAPISIIRWYIELMSDESIGSLTEKQKAYLSEISSSDQRLNEAINSLVVYLQLQSNILTINTTKVNIKELIGQIIQKLQSRIQRHKFNLQEIYPEEDVIVQIDAKLLTIVLGNLMENAIKHSEENGDIMIEVALADKKISIAIKANDYYSFKEKKSETLINSSSFKDLGFDLHLTKLILKKMKASMKLTPGKNKEMTFCVLLPI